MYQELVATLKKQKNEKTREDKTRQRKKINLINKKKVKFKQLYEEKGTAREREREREKFR